MNLQCRSFRGVGGRPDYRQLQYWHSVISDTGTVGGCIYFTNAFKGRL